MDVVSDDPLMTIREVCVFFGGGKPVAETTVRRWVRDGVVPRPIRIGPQVARWRRSDCQKALDAMADKSREVRHG